MKTHEKINSIDETHTTATAGEMKHVDQAGTNRRVTSSEKYKNIDLEKLRSECFAINQEFERKIELGRNLKKIINEEGFNIKALSEDMKEALKTYELYGKNIDKEEFKWLGWKMELRKYLGKQCNRKNIWVVDIEGKTFFQRKLSKDKWIVFKIS